MIIIDKPIPESCDHCPMNYDWVHCRALPDDSDISLSACTNTAIRQEWCPLKDARDMIREGRSKPLPIEIEGGGSTWWYVCPECHGAVDTWDRFCKHCGQALRADEKGDPDGHPEEDEPDYP